MSQENPTSLLNLNQCKIIVNKFNQENNKNFQVKTFTIVSATEVKGFLGEYYRLIIQCYNAKELNNNDNADNGAAIFLNFFVKTLPPVPQDHEKVAIFSKESTLYSTLLPALQKYSSEPWCPNVYLCNKNILVLEDLDSRGFYSLASKANLKEDEMLPVLNGLAAMHASSILYEYETKFNIEDIYGETLKEITVHPDIPWFRTGIEALVEIAKHRPKYQTKLSQTFLTTELPLQLKNVYLMANTSPKYRNVLCHRDTWGGNIFLSHNDSNQPAVLVDFQTCRYSPAAIDVIFTIFMNLSMKERLEKQSKYIKYYYNQVNQHIRNNISSNKSINKIVLSEEELLNSIEELKLFGLVYRALAITVLNVPKEFVTDYYKYEDRSTKLLQYMMENEEFCRLMEESIDEIVEAVVNSKNNKLLMF